ncbi:hypothetical protein [Aliivibrio fischeri]|uniref:hypothetical protein n=1 Tax=Aliivibrio fischeri TaxID=668 RepID=UPI0012D9E18E|nr:hypothetical protein [Aliivibrio fischeri]MUJ20451.1 hypothetical protein [Aliivibrio fischeri]
MKFLHIFYLTEKLIQVRLNKKNKAFNLSQQSNHAELLKAALQFRNECYVDGLLPCNLLIEPAKDEFKFSESKYHLRISAKSVSDNRTFHLLSKKNGHSFDEAYQHLCDVYAHWKIEYNNVVSLYNKKKLEKFITEANAELQHLKPSITSTSFDPYLWKECVESLILSDDCSDVEVLDDYEDVSYAFECELENTLTKTAELPDSIFIEQDKNRLSIKPKVIVNRSELEAHLIAFRNDTCSSAKYVPFSINFDYGSSDFLYLSIPAFLCGLPVNPSNHKIKIDSYNSLNQAIYFLAVCQSRFFGYKLFTSNEKPSYANYEYRVSEILMNSSSFGSAEGQILSFIHKFGFPNGTKQPTSLLFERNLCQRAYEGLVLHLNNKKVYFKNKNVSDIREKINLSILALLAINENSQLMQSVDMGKEQDNLDKHLNRYEYLNAKLANISKNYPVIGPGTTSIPLSPISLRLNRCAKCGAYPDTVYTPPDETDSNERLDMVVHQYKIHCPNDCSEEICVRSKHVSKLHDAALRWSRVNINSLITTRSYMFGLRSTFSKFGVNAHRVKILLIEEYLSDVYEHQRLSILLKDFLGLKLNYLTYQVNENSYKWAKLLSDRVEMVFGHKNVSLEDRQLLESKSKPTGGNGAKSVYYCEPISHKVICRSSADKVRFY